MMALLRAGLWEQPSAGPLPMSASAEEHTVPVDGFSPFPLTPEEWQALYAIACEQAVVGVVWQGVSLLPQEFMPPYSTVMRWVAHVDAIERRNAVMDGALASLLSLYKECGVEPVVLKGHTVAAMYVAPALRQSGDIDLYFPNVREREKAEEIVRGKGFSLDYSADGSSVFSWQGVTIEHHSSLFDLQRPRSVKIVESTVQGIENLFLPLQVDNNLVIKALAPQLNLLLLSTHILKHALGRGVGLRQLCDMAVACNAARGAVDEAEQRTLYAALGLERWSALLHSFMVQCLGLPVDALPWQGPSVNPDPLLRIVCKGGNFGQHAGGGSDNSVATRKIDTALSFVRNIGFCAKYAPGEAIYTFWQLLKGQCRRQ